MKKIILLLLAGLLFISCSGLFQDSAPVALTGDVSFAVSRSALKSAISRTEETYYDTTAFVVSLAGGYNATQSYIISENDTEVPESDEDFIKFTNVPVGASIYVEAKLFSYNQDPTSSTPPDFSQMTPDAYGRSSPVVVTEGINYISLKLFNFYGRFPFTVTLNFDGVSESELSSLANGFTVYGVAKESSLGRSITDAASDNVKIYEALATDVDRSAMGVGLSNQSGYENFTVSGSSVLVNVNLYLPIDFTAPAEKGQECFVIAAKRTENYATNPITYKTKYFGQSTSLIPYKTTTNTASFTVSKMNLIDTPVVTYDYSNTGYSFQLDGTSAYSSTNDRYCFDPEGNVYYLTISGNNSSIKASNKTTALTMTNFTPTGITYDFAQNKFYVYQINQASLNLYDVTSAINAWDTSLIDISSWLEINYQETAENTLSSFNHSLITINDDILYDIGQNNYGTGDIRFVIIELSNCSGAIDEPQSVVDLQLDALNLSSDKEITDIIYSDGMVYLLIKDYLDTMSTWTYSESHPYIIKSHGAIIRYNPSDGAINTIGLTNTNFDNSGKSLYAYYETSPGAQIYSDSALENKVKITNNTDYINSRFPTLCSPVSLDSKQFFGPQKFIAIKPKKLVIADDGIMFYSDGTGLYHYKNANRIVTVDLDDFAIIKTETTTSSFNMEKTNDIRSSAFGYYPDIFGNSSPTLYYLNPDTNQVATVPTNTYPWICIPIDN